MLDEEYNTETLPVVQAFLDFPAYLLLVPDSYRQLNCFFTGASGNSRINKFSKQLRNKVLLKSFPMNGHILGFCP